MGRKRRARQTAKPPLTREQLDRYAVVEPRTWKELKPVSRETYR
jgi:hypothetical protein